jgi:hypothetical protein
MFTTGPLFLVEALVVAVAVGCVACKGSVIHPDGRRVSLISKGSNSANMRG